MLALRTGWTEQTIADEISDEFRRACHHALYAQRVGSELTWWRAKRAQLNDQDLTQTATSERAKLRHDRQVAELAVTHYETALGLTEPVADG